jgi:glycerate 2-kinase
VWTERATIPDLVASQQNRFSEVKSAMYGGFREALAAVDPSQAVTLALMSQRLVGPVTVLALGKAASSMAKGAVAALSDQIVGGVVVSQGPGRVRPPLLYMEGNHPYPDSGSLKAGTALLREAARANGSLLVLVSGGGSAMAEAPVPGISLDDLIATYRQLNEAGIAIDQANTVRRHLSTLKNGGLLASTSVPVLTLLIADVAGAPASAIASGPTIPDSTTPNDALRTVRDIGLWNTLPASVLQALRSRGPSRVNQSRHTWEVLIDGSHATLAAMEHVRKLGFEAAISPMPLSGDAADQARRLTWTAVASTITIYHGETVVKVQDGAPGGRNQHAALAAAIALEGQTAVFASFATDGRDGSTDAAGAMVDGATCHRIRASGAEPRLMLSSCRAHEALKSSGDLVVTGPTGTNVADLWMTWRESN